jgi:hypothetical protein
MLVVIVLAATGAAAEETPPPPAPASEVTTRTVTVEALREAPDSKALDAPRALEEPAFVTVIRNEDHRGETQSVAEVLAGFTSGRSAGSGRLRRCRCAGRRRRRPRS